MGRYHWFDVITGYYNRGEKTRGQAMDGWPGSCQSFKQVENTNAFRKEAYLILVEYCSLKSIVFVLCRI